MIDRKDCMKAVGKLTMLKCFPSDPIAQGEIALFIQRLVATPEQLEWLVETLINHVGEWPGPKELRGLFCCRFKPLDGIEEFCSIPGYSPASCKAENLEAHERLKGSDARRFSNGLRKIDPPKDWLV